MSNRILFITNTLKVGGAAKMLLYVANLCDNTNYSINLVSLFDNESLESEDDRINLGINTTSYFWRIEAIKKIREVVKRIRPDMVCVFVSDVVFISRLATWGLKTIFVGAERGDPYTLSAIWKVLIKWTYKHCDYCFFQLEKARDYFGKTVRNKSFVIPNSFVPIVEPYHGIREKIIVSAGRFVSEKGYDILIKAFKIVSDKHPDYKLVIYGDGRLREEYIKLASDIGVQDKVSFPGYSRNVSLDIQKAQVFVLSSKYEGIPNSLIEAMACGIPTVSTDCTPGGPAFLTQNGTRGILVPVDNIESMANAINTIIENSKIAEELSIQGYNIVNELSPDIIDKKWVDALNSIFQER